MDDKVISPKTLSRNKRSNCSNVLSMLTNQLQDEVTMLNFLDFDNFNNTHNHAFILYSNKHKLIKEQVEKLINDKSKDKFENWGFEQKYEKRMKNLLEKLKELKTEREKLKLMLDDKNEEIKELALDIEVIETYHNNNNFTERLKRSIPLLIESNKNPENTERKMILRINFMKMYDKLEDKKNKLIIEKSMRDKLVKELDDSNHKYQMTKDEIQQIKNALLLHYHKLLSEGRDTRKEGLIWIIKAIWALGCTVVLSYFPSFLDEELICYLFKYARKDIEYRKTIDKKKELKEKLKNNCIKEGVFERELTEQTNAASHRSLSLAYKNSNETKSNVRVSKKSVLCDDILLEKINVYEKPLKSERLLPFGKVNNPMMKDELNEQCTIKSVSKKLDIVRSSSQHSMDMFQKLKELDKSLEIIHKEIEDIKNKELKRISNEFLTNEYGRRFGVSEENVISAMIGEENVYEEYGKFIREQKIHQNRIKLCRSFNMMENNQNTVLPVVNNKRMDKVNRD